MPPTADIYTDRYFLRLTGPMGDHETLFRFANGTPMPDAKATINAVVQAIKGQLFNGCTFDKMRYSAAGSNLSFPTPWGAVACTAATQFDVEEHPQFISFTGRTLTGKRVRLTFFGYPGSMTANYRLEPAEAPLIQATLDALEDTAPYVRGIDGSLVVWNQYGNTGRNAYFQRKARRS